MDLVNNYEDALPFDWASRMAEIDQVREQLSQAPAAKETGLYGTRWKIGNPVVPPAGHEVKQPSQFGNCFFVKSVTPAGKVWLTEDPVHHIGAIGPFYHLDLVSNFAGENKEPEEPLPAKYGSSSCPNSPNACYCTGKCQPGYVDSKPRFVLFGPGGIRSNKAITAEADAATLPKFVEEHNAMEPAVDLPTKQALAQAKANFAPIDEVLKSLTLLMQYKNRKYGGSALVPVNVLSKGSTLEKLLARADDKIARIQNSTTLRKNDVCDLMGYLVLICAKQGWSDFTDQQD
jgi:hypothetical protein